MAINVSQPFHRTSANAVDDTLTLTKAEMLAVNDNLMPSKYLTVCQDDGFIYLYDKSATPNQTTGKFTKFEGGGGGVSDYDDLTDKPQIGGVTLSGNKSLSDLGITKSGLGLGSVVNTGDSSTPTSGGTTKFTTGGAYTELAKKQDKLTAGTNITISSNTISASMGTLGIIDRSNIYSTTEKVVGCWTDGRPLYQKNIPLQPKQSSYSAYTVSISSYLANVTYTNIIAITGFYNETSNNNRKTNLVFEANEGNLIITNTTSSKMWSIQAIVLYTKSTDATSSYNYSEENDYSTTEKVVGSWIDGKTIYQKTFTGTVTAASTGGVLVTTSISMGVSVSQYIKYEGAYKNANVTGAWVPFLMPSNIADKTQILVPTGYDNTADSANKNKIIISNGRPAAFQYYLTVQYLKV